MLRILFTLFLSSLIGITQAQFTDISWQLEQYDINLTSPTNGYGSGISFFDFNKDGWDDISLSGGTAHPIFLINNEGSLEVVDLGITNFGDARMHSMLWVDYDNDGDSDLFISRQNGPMQLWQNDGNMNFTNVAEEAGLEQAIYIYANAAWADYNHDGCLDFYVTKNYSFFDYVDTLYTSKLYVSNCDGTFTDVTLEAGVLLIPRTELQPAWVDINNDGWEDLFIAVDRLPFQNELFLNNKDGTFTRISEDAGINDYLDAMGVSVADYDHNGYLDIYVGNNPIDPGNVFYHNNGDLTFENIAPQMELDLGVESTLSTWGALWIDYDNNMWEDLFLATMIFTGQPHPGSLLYRNNEGMSFTDITEWSNINGGGPVETFTAAMGDLNNDGYYDYVITNRHPYTPRLKLNNGGTNNWLSVELQGTISNRDGIGTWIRCYVGGKELVRYTMCGENLAGQNSSKKIFGLAQHTIVDSLVLDWNMGTHEVYYDVDINQFLYLIEGASFLEPINITYDGDLQICFGETIVLQANTTDDVVWNNGHIGQNVTISTSGQYFATVTNQFGLTINTDTVEVIVTPQADIIMDVQHISCTNANDGSISVSLSNGPIQQIIWSNSSDQTTITDLDNGLYTFTAIDMYGCEVSGAATIVEPAPLFAQGVPTNATCYGTATGSVMLQTIGGTSPFTTDWFGQNPDALTAGNYSALVTDDHGCTVTINFTIGQPDSIAVVLSVTPATASTAEDGAASVTVSGGTPPYQVLWSTGAEDVFDIDGLAPGIYSVEVTDANGCVWSTDFVVMYGTGVYEFGESPLRLFPNPANQSVQISGCKQGVVGIEIIDSNGKIVLSEDHHHCKDKIAVDRFAAGIYLMRIVENENVHQLRLVIGK